MNYPIMELRGVVDTLPVEITTEPIPSESEVTADTARSAGEYAIFRVVGDCMERAEIEDGGWVAVDFKHMPRPPKYGKDGYIDPCLCFAIGPGQRRPAVMCKAYDGKWGSQHRVSTRYRNGHLFDIGMEALEIYGVVFASWDRNGKLLWQRDPENFPKELPEAATLRDVNFRRL